MYPSAAQARIYKTRCHWPLAPGCRKKLASTFFCKEHVKEFHALRNAWDMDPAALWSWPAVPTGFAHLWATKFGIDR